MINLKKLYMVNRHENLWLTNDTENNKKIGNLYRSQIFIILEEDKPQIVDTMALKVKILTAEGLIGWVLTYHSMKEFAQEISG